MAGTLTVQNLQGPSSGANANKIIVPSGQTIDASAGTLVPSAGQVVQSVHGTNYTETTLTPATGELALITISFTPLYSDSLIRVHWSHGQVTRVSSGGTSSWLSLRCNVDGAQSQALSVGALGYPETFSSQRYMPSRMGYIDSWSGAKTIVHAAEVGSIGSDWIINHQNNVTCMEITEIKQ